MKLMFVVDPHLSDRTPSGRADNYPESVLSKLSFVSSLAKEKGVHSVYVTGDVFSNKDVGWGYFHRVLETFGGFPCPVSTIAGNHDLRWDRVDTLPTTPLGVLFRTGSLQHLKMDVTKGDVPVAVHGCDYKTPIPVPVQGAYNILVAHYAYGDLWGEKGLEDKDLQGFNVAVLGHDHTTYPAFWTPGGCVVLRSGSLSRGTAGFKDRTRIPLVAVLDTGDSSVELIPVPCLPESEAFRQQAVQQNEVKSEMRDYVKTLTGGGGTGAEVSVSDLIAKHSPEGEVRDRVTHHMTEAGLL